MPYRLKLITVLLLVSLFSKAQNEKRFSDSVFHRFSDNKVGYHKDRSFYIIKTVLPFQHEMKPVRMLGNGIYITKLNDSVTYNNFAANGLIAVANDDWKLSPSLDLLFRNKGKGTVTLIISSDNPEKLSAHIQTIPSVNILSRDEPSGSLIIECDRKVFAGKILPLNELLFADEKQVAHTEIGIIGYDRSFHGINAVDYLLPGANGKNINVGVKEQRMQEADLDLYKRVLISPLAASTIENHATVISSIIGGAGNSFYDGRGIANGCRFFSSSFSNLFADDQAILNQFNINVQNHSYGTIIQQFYGAEALSYDLLCWNNKKYLGVFSAGNRGTSSATDGRYANLAGFANLTGNFKMAKNIITVGAVNNAGNIVAESSAGPLYDGRVAPQLSALGPNGTSDAAAMVSGAIAVMQQVYADSNAQATAPASLIKAILYNNATDIGKTGIDYKTGYGLLDSYESTRALMQKKYDGGIISQGQAWTKQINVPNNAANVKVTLSWTDTTVSLNNNKALVNDLDIELVDLSSGTIYKPWVLSSVPHIDSLDKVPVRKRDSLNTAEQVSVDLPAAGNYNVIVKGISVTGSIPFHISYKTDTLNVFHFTSPQHASDVNRNENPELTIRWKTFVADTNTTGNLSVSFNRGLNWQLIKTGHKIYTNQLTWRIKDTASVATLKMDTPFGSFLSNDFIISPVTRISVDFNCSDSFRLSWQPHVYAIAYRLFTLTDSPYLKHILTVTDTAIVLKKSLYPSKLYAVEPVLSVNVPAARSVAIDYELQGVQCFYKTLNYNLLDGNALRLILELSIETYADSVYFEQVTAAGVLIKVYGGAKVIRGNRTYILFVPPVSPGVNYLRGRIKLNNGQIVYTDIIPVLTTGDRKIIFYPNPVSKDGSLQYILQQGVPYSCKLNIYNNMGNLVRKYESMPNRISISLLNAGLYYYTLYDPEGKLLQQGKFIIQ